MIAEKANGLGVGTPKATDECVDVNLTECRACPQRLLSYYTAHLYDCERAADLLALYGVINDPVYHSYVSGALVRTGGRYFQPDPDGRQAQILTRQGIVIDRSTLALWAG